MTTVREAGATGRLTEPEDAPGSIVSRMLVVIIQTHCLDEGGEFASFGGISGVS